ncbi:hypothetical protein [Methanobacterium sp. SMA-27]|uniref:hypothetical protein n=1 Tax=Methanobacterium sp. SMA-27 TaxID=1495336 RepID=UPI0012E00A19|nr:hypothetical protein [Methanobacterium sp. SMA-27]
MLFVFLVGVVEFLVEVFFIMVVVFVVFFVKVVFVVVLFTTGNALSLTVILAPDELFAGKLIAYTP